MNFNGQNPNTTLKRLRVEGDGSFGGNVAIAGDLTVFGTTNLPVIEPTSIAVEDGKESAPSYTFQDEKDTGWYRSAPGEVSFSGQGTKRLRIGETSSESTGTWAATKLFSDDGTATSPAVAFTSDTTSGWYKSNPGETSFTSLGTPRFNIGQIASSTPTTFTSLRNYTTDGTTATPSTSYASEPSTGWYRSGLGEVTYSGRGTRRFRIGEASAEFLTGSFTASGPVIGDGFIPSGTTAMASNSGVPSIVFNSLTAPWEMKVNSNVSGRFTSLGAEFPFGATTPILGATTSSLGTASASSLNVTTLTATTSTLGTATASSLTASTMTATTSTVTTLTVTTGNISTLNATTSSLGSMVGSTLSLSDQSYLELENTNSMTITTNTDTLVTFTNVFRQVGTGLNLDVDNGTIVVTSSTNGFYAVTAVCQWSFNATGTRESFLLRNSSYRVAWSVLPAPATGNQTTSITATTYMLTSGSTMQFRVWQTSGGDLTLSAIRLYMGRVW